jgi:hypothetical protein
MNNSFYLIALELLYWIADQRPYFLGSQFIRMSILPEDKSQRVGKFEIDLMVRMLPIHIPITFRCAFYR